MKSDRFLGAPGTGSPSLEFGDQEVASLIFISTDNAPAPLKDPFINNSKGSTNV
jgi:hypothetical protein